VLNHSLTRGFFMSLIDAEFFEFCFTEFKTSRPDVLEKLLPELCLLAAEHNSTLAEDIALVWCISIEATSYFIFYHFFGCRYESRRSVSIVTADEADFISVFFRYFSFVHSIFLDRVYNIKFDFDKIVQKNLNISAAVKPKVHTKLVRRVYHLLIIRLKKLLETFKVQDYNVRGLKAGGVRLSAKEALKIELVGKK